MPYRYLEHKADLLIEATGNDFKQAVESAAQGMFDAISKVQGDDSVGIECRADTLEDLAVDVLSELLAQGEILEIPFTRFEVTEFTREPPGIKGTAYGKKGAATIGSVKAVTYHELSVKEENGKVTIRVLLDI